MVLRPALQELVGLRGKAEAASAAARKQYQQTSSSAQSRWALLLFECFRKAAWPLKLTSCH